MDPVGFAGSPRRILSVDGACLGESGGFPRELGLVHRRAPQRFQVPREALASDQSVQGLALVLTKEGVVANVRQGGEERAGIAPRRPQGLDVEFEAGVR